MGTSGKLPAYRLLKDRFAHKAGTICYVYQGHDYGLCAEDERVTGVPCEAMTLDPAGAMPFFTVPLHDLERT